MSTQTPTPHAAQPRRRRIWPWLALAATGLLLVAVAVVAATPRGPAPAAAPVAPSAPPSPSPAPTPAAPKPAGISDGIYQIGVDTPTGRYKTPGPATRSDADACYWARRSDDSGQGDAIIANGILKGPGYVTVKAGEFLELTGGCVWTRQ